MPSVKWSISHDGYYDYTRMEPRPVNCSHRSPNALHHSAVRLSNVGKRDGLAFNSGLTMSYASCMFEFRNHLCVCCVAKHTDASESDTIFCVRNNMTSCPQ